MTSRSAAPRRESPPPPYTGVVLGWAAEVDGAKGVVDGENKFFLLTVAGEYNTGGAGVCGDSNDPLSCALCENDNVSMSSWVEIDVEVPGVVVVGCGGGGGGGGGGGENKYCSKCKAPSHQAGDSTLGRRNGMSVLTAEVEMEEERCMPE